MNMNERNILVLGLGESGLAMVRWCAWRGARVTVADSREAPPGLAELSRWVPDAQLRLGRFDSRLLDGIDMVLLSPGIDPRIDLVAEARQRLLPISGELNVFCAALDELGARSGTRIIALTGTNGKTTTATLCAHLARSAGLDAVAAGNISPAMLTILLERLQAGRALPECWVLELSSFQLETPHNLRAEAAALLNISEDHLDRYDDMDEYRVTKSRIFLGSGCQVVNRDDPAVMQSLVSMPLGNHAMHTFGLDAPVGEDAYGLVVHAGVFWLARGQTLLMPLRDLPLSGLHNAANALAALALCEAVGLPREALLNGLRRFHGLPHRVQVVAERRDGVLFYDDSKGTNVGATCAAIAGLARPVVLIAGGEGKGQNFALMRDAVARYVHTVILIGADRALIAEALKDLPNTCIRLAGSMDAAVAAANAAAAPGDVVLLSPACASFDMFANYAARGDAFVASVAKLDGVTRR